MCLALPAEVIKIIDSETAVAAIGGVAKEISTVLIDSPAVGDYIILHAGYALNRLDEAEAEKTLALFADMLKEA